ncbi:sulfur carrier protein ThiS [Mariniblastus fucicola]|uniref:Sulfur carrier protein ThiS n=1 Tax=Mariniblastus fucicola TaxID=980251 RepID=A0A5B9PEP2_9BACT|nr:sulfur carrier protein ThiS [Mariniblastus fucicola]QEG23989.1 sulfur carrier protein ThiS [Mariniblastus fucicola]
MSDLDQSNIKLNGEPFAIEADWTIEDLLVRLAAEKHGNGTSAQSKTFGAVAVELNAEIVPRNQFSQTNLNAGDEVEVVTLVGGG